MASFARDRGVALDAPHQAERVAERDPHRQIALLHPQLDLDPERPRLLGAPGHPAVDDRHDRRRETALGERPEPHLGDAFTVWL